MERLRPFVVLLLLAGCSRTLQATAHQPNPLKYPKDTLRESAKLFIYVGHQDMDSIKTIMANSARFVVVSKDRLRFHVTIEHKWEEWADVNSWQVWLEDETGKRYHPETKELSKNRNKSDYFEYDRRQITTDTFGNITRVAQPGVVNTRQAGWDAAKERPTITSIDRFQGAGDYVFSSPDLFDQNVRRLTLHMSRGGVEYRYVWHFGDGPTRIAHHKQGTLGTQGGFINQGPLSNGQ